MSRLTPILSYLLLGLCTLLCVVPFAYMLSLSLQSDAELMSGLPVLIPEKLQFSNYVDHLGARSFRTVHHQQPHHCRWDHAAAPDLRSSCRLRVRETEVPRQEDHVRGSAVDPDDPVLHPADPPLYHHGRVRLAQYISRAHHAVRHERLWHLSHAPVHCANSRSNCSTQRASMAVRSCASTGKLSCRKSDLPSQRWRC